MSKDLDARLRRLEQKQSTPDYSTLKPITPLAGMSDSWVGQYHRDAEVLSIIWQDVIKEYNEQHINEWRQHPETYANADGTISGIPPWYRLLPDDNAVWYKECKERAETKLILWLTVGGQRKEILRHDDG